MFILVAYFVCGAVHDVETGKYVMGGIMVAALMGFWISMALMFTNSVPALLWRYRARLPLRTISIDGDKYKQIKLYGFWFFIGHDNDFEAPKTAFWRWPEDYKFREYRFEPQTFFDFINAHRNIEISSSSNHELYVKGEKV